MFLFPLKNLACKGLKTFLLLKLEYSGCQNFLNVMSADATARCIAGAAAAMTLPSISANFEWLQHLSVEKWYKSKYMFVFCGEIQNDKV